MRNIILIAAMLSLSIVSVPAQEATKEFNLKVNTTDIQTIGEALGSLPYAKVAPLMIKLQQQINEANMSKPPEAPGMKDIAPPNNTPK